jgi:hypothetical protein
MLVRAVFASALFVLGTGTATATSVKSDPSTAEIDKIIRKFAENESAFAKAREVYMYRQTARILEFDAAGTPGGKFERVDEITFTPGGKRLEKAVKAPVPTLRMIMMSAQDEQDLRHVMPFVLTSEEIDNYLVRYLGRQNADEIPCYVFAVKPKKLEPGKRYFQGQIWVDDRDLMIVKSYGRSIGLLKKGEDQQFPKFETYREQIDGQFWFPTYTVANSTLHFENQTVQIKQTVKYEDYKRFGAESKIISVEETTEPPAQQPAPAAPKPAPPRK